MDDTIDQKAIDLEWDLLMERLGIDHDKFLKIQNEDLNEMGV